MTVPDTLLTFDTETTGVSVDDDRIVSAHVGLLERDGAYRFQQTWLINPGVAVSPEATAVHGFTAEHLAEHGTDPGAALLEIADILAEYHCRHYAPLVAFNAPFDLTILDRELRRIPGSTMGLGFEPRPVIDPFVIDKGIDTYRKGSRKLVDVAKVMNTPVAANAHDAAEDGLMAGMLAFQLLDLLDRKPRRSGHDLPLAEYLHERQITWRAEQAASLEQYLRRSKPDAVVDPSWPMRAWAQ